MITLIKEPELFSGVGNPIYLKAETDNMWLNVGAKSDGTINIVTASIVPGEYLELEINGVKYRWTFVAGVAGPDQISTTGLSILIIKAEILKNRDIYNWYNVTTTTGPDTLRLEAKNYGAKYDFTISTNSVTKFTMAGLTTNGEDFERKNGFRLLADVYIAGEADVCGTYEPIPDTDYTDVWAEFFIENVLKPYLAILAPKANNASTVLEASKTVRKYSLKIYEKFVEDLKSNYYNPASVAERWAWAGGVDWQKWPIDKADISNDYFETTTLRKFLSLKPRKSYIQRNEEQYLYYWCGGDGSGNLDLTSRWTVYYKNGTNETVDIIYSPVDDKVAVIPAWLEAITGLAQSRDNIVRANLQVLYDFSGGGGVTSEVWQFDVRIATLDAKNIQIRNSMGGYDSWMMTGGDVLNASNDGIMTEGARTEDYLNDFSSPYPTILGTDKKQAVEQRRVMKLTSGHINEDHAIWLMNEVASSVLVHEDDRLVEWRVSSKTSDNVKSNAGSFEFTITIEEGFIKNRF